MNLAGRMGGGHRLRLAACAALLILAQPAAAQPSAGARFDPKPLVRGQRYMATSAHPSASAAGADILRRGGSAVDAAIAMQLVLGLVEPQSSGIGGGAFLLHYAAGSSTVDTYDGRETAPAAAGPDLFLDSTGKPMPFRTAVIGGRSVGVPGLIRMAAMAHRAHGRLQWKALFAPAIHLAEHGFPVSYQLARWLAQDRQLKDDPEARVIYYAADGSPAPDGATLRNPAYARTLRMVARQGPDWFYRGENARAIVGRVRGHATNPGVLAETDMAGYRARRRAPLCFAYRDHEICSMAPPSSGGTAIAQILGMLEHTGFAQAAPMSATALHLYAEAAKLAFADRNRYVADSDFVTVPPGLTDRAYLAIRAQSIGTAASAAALPGVPPGTPLARADDRSPELPSTSHLSVVDARGNAVSMTTTVETIFGSHLMTGGYILNNQLTDFSFVAEEDGRPVANRVEAGKRPRSSMTPVLVFARGADGSRGALRLVAGSPGGSFIINFVGKVLVATLDWQLPLDEALALPNFGSRNAGLSGALEIERDRFPAALAQDLQALGHTAADIPVDSGVHAIARACTPTPAAKARSCFWQGAADPRRDGRAVGR
jgi:gamma-glutamyltranspeptidase/glutathione hydrolase